LLGFLAGGSKEKAEPEPEPELMLPQELKRRAAPPRAKEVRKWSVFFIRLLDISREAVIAINRGWLDGHLMAFSANYGIP
jgi:hypothetical protein